MLFHGYDCCGHVVLPSTHVLSFFSVVTRSSPKHDSDCNLNRPRAGNRNPWTLLNRNSPACPQESCTLAYDRAKCSVSIHNFWGFQEVHVKVLKVMSLPIYDLKMHFNFIKEVQMYQTDWINMPL